MSILRANFGKLVDQAMSQPGRAAIRPVIEKELLHYDILFALDRRGLLRDLVFQGGTSLRLCHGSHRFSEDLDFAGGPDFDFAHLEEMADALESYLGDRYGLDVGVKAPKGRGGEQLSGSVLVEKWQVSVTTSPERRDLPRQRIKIEVANVPAHEVELKPLQRNYDFLPTGYEDLLIQVEPLHEVLADKLLAFPVTLATHVRHRDIWDMQWLIQQGAAIRPDLVGRKIIDYGVDNYAACLEEAIARLPEVVESRAFADEMRRFLPQDRIEATFERSGFLPYLAGSLQKTLRTVQKELDLGEAPRTDSFEM